MDKSIDKQTKQRKQQQQQQHQSIMQQQAQTQLQLQPPTTPRSTLTKIRKESLPTPPPAPNQNSNENTSENIFKYPTNIGSQLPDAFQPLLNYAERQDEFYKNLTNAITTDCKNLEMNRIQKTTSTTAIATGDIVKTDATITAQQLYDECKQFMDPMHIRHSSAISAALAAYGAIEQLNRLYAMWDKYCEMENKIRQRKECLRYVHLLQDKIDKVRTRNKTPSQSQVSDTEAELEESIILLDSILATEKTNSLKRNTTKQQRGRSKSVMSDDITALTRDRDAKGLLTGPHLLRRQSTYHEGGKSKVSKWTKVKAAFKWERANVPVLSDNTKEQSHGVGLTPINHEVARYLRVPSLPCGGGSSADSILSSSSGHLLSDVGTPGTISSASSVDDIAAATANNTIRRDSSKSDTTKYESYINDDECMKSEATAQSEPLLQKLFRNDSNKFSIPNKSPSIKSMRKCRVSNEFEVLPEGVEAEIKSTSVRKQKFVPSPLDLNLKQDLNDVDHFYSPQMMRSPKDGTQSLNRTKKIHSPGNSSVPSSPSRHSDFFAEFESEDLSSGEFSEPTTPNHSSSRKSFQQKQNEINQRYQMLRDKLDLEFEAKRQEWEKLKSNPNTYCAITFINPMKSEEHSPKQSQTSNISAKLLEENLTPDFKKKLRKWRVKKQISIGGLQTTQQLTPHSPNKDATTTDQKPKIDWNLWKTGQIKLEGQGRTPLPDQKDLPEDFQKKLEQWNKLKKVGTPTDSLKRGSKHGDSLKKSSDDDRVNTDKEKRLEKHKPNEKDKMEKLAKLKAIVTDHSAKEIEVKTSAGVMKFEGISRKFTRKLYEWEKARGIGPESSTFALLHPGYCPIDVGRISKENQQSENSPTLSRSLSLDSISHNINLPTISQQASSLSLNDVNDLKDVEVTNSSDALAESEYKKDDEPEAVMVEVEDDIVETACPLVTTNALVEHQTPVYKYEEVSYNDYVNSKRIQSYESHTNLAPILSMINRTDELLSLLKKISPEIMAENNDVHLAESTLTFIKNIYPYCTDNLTKPSVLTAIADVQTELSRLNELYDKFPLDEACCQEIMLERQNKYKEELEGLRAALDLLRKSIHCGSQKYLKDIVPDINITSEEIVESELCAHDQVNKMSQNIIKVDTEKADAMQMPPPKFRPISSASFSGASKKKLRLRKFGSRQNSKTESDSSDADTHSVIETPRRIKRKNFRLKQRSLDEDYRRSEESNVNNTMSHDTVYVLKVRPGKPIVQFKNECGVTKSRSAILLSPTQVKATQFVPLVQNSNANNNNKNKNVNTKTSINSSTNTNVNTNTNTNTKTNTNTNTNTNINTNNSNIFVKTRRKLFTTIAEPLASDGIAVVAKDIDNSPQSDNSVRSNDKEVSSDVPTVNKTDTSEAIQFNITKKRKSLSFEHFTKFDNEIEAKYYSDGNTQSQKSNTGTRMPLASDSFRVINKNFSTLTRENSKNKKQVDFAAEPVKRTEHRFKKNADKLYNTISKSYGATVKKIEMKIAKTHSGSSVDQNFSMTPEKTDNTLPRISRKLPLTPTMKPNRFDFIQPTQSEPTTPLEKYFMNKPHTPQSERAKRLQKAKEDFLKSSIPRQKVTCKRRDEVVRNDSWELNRRSDNSFMTSTKANDNVLLKSMSVDTFTSDTPTQSDAGTDQDISGIYDSLPRTVSRSGKISSKLGFATLASKFRRTKVKKGKEGKESKEGKDCKDCKECKECKQCKTTGNNSSTLTTLCQRSLLADIIMVPQIVAPDSRPIGDSVIKSQSSPQAAVSIDQQIKNESLNKSQSEQYVKSRKESYV